MPGSDNWIIDGGSITPPKRGCVDRIKILIKENDSK